MKKTIILVYLLFCTVILVGCFEEKYSVSNGIYKTEQSISHYIEFDLEDQEFIFPHTEYLSYIPSGTFECKEGKVFAKDGEDLYVFTIVDNETISFLKSESAETPLPDGLIFKLIEE